MNSLVVHVGNLACTTPDAIALVDRTSADLMSVDSAGALSYAQFWNQACAFAGALHAAGLQAGGRVAIVLPNRIEAAVLVYGAWLAGGIAVPLNVQAHGQDLALWVRHCGALHLVYEASNTEAASAISQLETAIVAWPLEPGAWAAETFAANNALCAATTVTADPVPAAPALILYTSGTTGAPKGVTLSHANLLANAEAVANYLDLGSSDSVLALLPFYYAYGASVLHTHLLRGARVVLAPGLTFPPLVLETAAREQVTGLSGVASTFSLLLERFTPDRYDLSALRYLTQAGGSMPAALIQRLRTALPGPKLFLMYGQTEATSRLTWLPPERLDDKPGSVGIAVPGVRLRIKQASGHDAAIDSEGEVQVSGANVMLGYWGAPEATAAVFDAGWLCTGDIGWLDRDGFLYLRGRRDEMIKTGAHRVYPDEIEQVIAQLSSVAEAAVVGVDDATLGQIIKAYVVLDPPASPETQARLILTIKAHCRAQLAPYKIPRTIIFVAGLPRTASGKLHRAALTQFAAGSPRPGMARSTPRQPHNAKPVPHDRA